MLNKCKICFFISRRYYILNIEFTDNLEPTFGDHNGNPISLKEIYEIESINNKPITMIAVTRKQFDERDLDRYRKYVTNELGLSRFYHGFWHDGDSIEFDILYATSKQTQ